MAKLLVALVFLCFTLSFARTPLTLSVNDATNLQLPSANDVITLPESSDDSMHSKSETQTFHPVPLRFVTFQPINRRFRLRSNPPFRHHHLQPVLRREISYGNDVVLSSKKVDFDKFVYRVGMTHHKFGIHAHHFDRKKLRKRFHYHDEEEKVKKKGGMIDRIRNFLHH